MGWIWHKSLESLGYAIDDILTSEQPPLEGAFQLNAGVVIVDVELKGGLEAIQAGRLIGARWGRPIVYLVDDVQQADRVDGVGGRRASFDVALRARRPRRSHPKRTEEQFDSEVERTEGKKAASVTIEQPSVIWVGSTDGDDYLELSRAILKRGLGLASAATVKNLPDVLSRHARAVVVVCDRQTEQQSRGVVASMSSVGRRIPILVLVEEADFGDYYFLMNSGVHYYYEFREGPERISSALSQAASWAAA